MVENKGELLGNSRSTLTTAGSSLHQKKRRQLWTVKHAQHLLSFMERTRREKSSLSPLHRLYHQQHHFHAGRHNKVYCHHGGGGGGGGVSGISGFGGGTSSNNAFCNDSKRLSSAVTTCHSLLQCLGEHLNSDEDEICGETYSSNGGEPLSSTSSSAINKSTAGDRFEIFLKSLASSVIPRRSRDSLIKLSAEEYSSIKNKVTVNTNATTSTTAAVVTNTDHFHHTAPQQRVRSIGGGRTTDSADVVDAMLKNVPTTSSSNKTSTTATTTSSPSRLVLCWSYSSREAIVQVAGTFTRVPWVERLKLKWCKGQNFHYIDLSKCSNVTLSQGVHQFKFIVNDVWCFDPQFPVCCDGSSHLNNVMVVLSSRMRSRMASSKLRNRCEKHHAPGTSSSANVVVDSNINTTNTNINNQNNNFGCANNHNDNNNNNNYNSSTPTATKYYRQQARINPGGLVSYPQWASLEACAKAASVSRKFKVRQSSGGIKSNHLSSPPTPVADSFPPVISGWGPASSLLLRKAMIQLLPVPQLPGAADPSSTWSSSFSSLSPGSILSTEVKWPQAVTERLYSPVIQFVLSSSLDKFTNSVKTQQPVKLDMTHGFAMLPHPDRMSSGGADAFYISSDNRCIALADGVALWETFGFGYSSQKYAEELLDAIRRIWEDKTHPIHHLKAKVKPSEIAKELMRLVFRAPTNYGSSTLSIVILNPEMSVLGCANLGDSAMAVLTREKLGSMGIKHITKRQTHFFNCPYQFSRLPAQPVLDKIKSKVTGSSPAGATSNGSSDQPSDGSPPVPTMQQQQGGGDSTNNSQTGGMLVDLPEHAELYDVPLEEGDLLVVASDGLWDNLFPAEIQDLCSRALSPLEASILHDESFSTSVENLARALAEASIFRARESTAKTPWSQGWMQNYGDRFLVRGGKFDDTTVICSWVVRESHTLTFPLADTLSASTATQTGGGGDSSVSTRAGGTTNQRDPSSDSDRSGGSILSPSKRERNNFLADLAPHVVPRRYPYRCSSCNFRLLPISSKTCGGIATNGNRDEMVSIQAAYSICQDRSPDSDGDEDEDEADIDEDDDDGDDEDDIISKVCADKIDKEVFRRSARTSSRNLVLDENALVLVRRSVSGGSRPLRSNSSPGTGNSAVISHQNNIGDMDDEEDAAAMDNKQPSSNNNSGSNNNRRSPSRSNPQCQRRDRSRRNDSRQQSSMIIRRAATSHSPR